MNDKYYCVSCNRPILKEDYEAEPEGYCEECRPDNYFCNRCGQEISYMEYYSNVEGYCEDCYEELEEEEEEND